MDGTDIKIDLCNSLLCSPAIDVDDIWKDTRSGNRGGDGLCFQMGMD
jgi:hypothetical protein